MTAVQFWAGGVLRPPLGGGGTPLGGLGTPLGGPGGSPRGGPPYIKGCLTVLDPQKRMAGAAHDPNIPQIPENRDFWVF